MNETEESSEPSDQKTRRLAGLAGATLFGAAAVMELVRMLTATYPWPGFNVRLNWIWSVVAVALWLGSAYVLAVRRRDSIVLAVLGAFALVNHGLLGTIGGSYFGVVYIAMGVVMVILERLAFGGRLTLGERWTPTRQPSAPQVL